LSGTPAIDALRQGLVDLHSACEHISTTVQVLIFFGLPYTYLFCHTQHIAEHCCAISNLSARMSVHHTLVSCWNGLQLSYCEQIVRQLRTQYVEGTHGAKYYTVTLKSRLRVTQGHWKWYHLKAWVRFPIRFP